MRGAAIAILAAALLGGCVSLGSHEADRYEVKDTGRQTEEVRKLSEEADALYAEPRTVERVERSMAVSLDSVSPENGHAGLWRAARAAAWLAESHPEKDRREWYARRGIALARESLARSPDRVEPHYYLALNLARLSDIRKTPQFVDEMAGHAERAIERDEKYDRAGPHRFLGLLHLRTEGKLVVGFGDLDLALKHLKRAVELFPDDPENRAAYAEAQKADEN